MGHALGESQLDVPRQATATRIVGLELSADVLQRDADGEVCLLVEVAKPGVCGQSEGRVFGDGGVEDLHRQPTPPTIREVVGIGGTQARVGGREVAREVALRIGLLHAPVVDVREADGPRAAVAVGACIDGATDVDTADVVHIAQPHHAVHLAPQQRGVVKDEGRIGLHERDRVPPQCAGPGRHGET